MRELLAGPWVGELGWRPSVGEVLDAIEKCERE